ncbi:MAG: CHAP domain-containing protein [Bacillota bacterium]|nr:CHAP domain-containing protein [Bacillota bacterium]
MKQIPLILSFYLMVGMFSMPIFAQEETWNDPEPETTMEENENPSLEEENMEPVLLEGYRGDVYSSILEENFITNNWDVFTYNENPFSLGQCTYFAWSRFYQFYGYDSGARSHGKYNAQEIAQTHSSSFCLSVIPTTGSVFSIEKEASNPTFGHVGFVEYFDGQYIWISEGNVQIDGVDSYIRIHKEKWDDFKMMFPDIVFAIPKTKYSLEPIRLPMRKLSQKLF